MRYIDADALKDRLQALSYEDWNQGVITSWADAYRECADMVEDMPTIEPERKTGKWIKISPAGIYECSECGQNVMTNDIVVYRWCHGCGAEMEGEQE